MAKPKVAFYWCASCGGCEEAVVDLAETILKVVEAVDIVFWPCALDFKKTDVEAMEDGSIAAVFINGAVNSNEQEEMVHMLRKKAGLVIAFGACAHLGGIPALANLTNKEAIFKASYLDGPTNDNQGKTVPLTETPTKDGILTLPEMKRYALSLDEVIDVDYYLPGCSVPTKLIVDAVMAILEGKLPPKGSVLAPSRTNCDTCERNKTKPDKLSIPKFYRPYEIELDEEKCFMAQGVICMGPVTRGGCDERCIKGNMPCRGCFGPVDQVQDQGAKFISALASLFDAKTEEEVQQLVDSIADPAGTFYRFSMSKSYLKHKVQ
jgi:F420-non-reducing hydrogenase small subunit